MKRLLLATLLYLISFNCFAATLPLGPGSVFPLGPSSFYNGVSSGCSQATALLARMDGSENASAASALVCGMVADGTYSLMDGLYVFATSSLANAKLNWAQNAYNLTVDGTCTFTANNGFTGDASTCYLDPSFTPSSAGGNYTQNSASVGACSLSNRTTSQAWTLIGSNGSPTTVNLELDNLNGGAAYGEINGDAYPSYTNAQGQGSWITSRTSSAGYELYLNNNPVLAATSTSLGNVNADITILAYNEANVPRIFQNTGDQVAYAFIGGGLTSTQVSQVYSRLETYLVAVGASTTCANLPPVTIDGNVNVFGTYNLTSGTEGPYWVGQDIWNNVTALYSGVSTNSTTTMSNFSSVVGISGGMAVYASPNNIPSNTTVSSVGSTSIVMSAAASSSLAGQQVEFGLLPGGGFYTQTITSTPATFPNGVVASWSWPSQLNANNVYSYPEVVYGIGGGGYYIPANLPASKLISSFSNLSVTYNLTETYGTNDSDCLLETWPTSVALPQSPAVDDTRTNEISFLCHTPSYLSAYITNTGTFPTHLNYSSGGFNAYIVTTGSTPPQTLIMPVTAPNGSTPLDMTSGTQTMPILGVMQYLVAQGVIPDTSYISGFEFGHETGRNSGTSTYNSVSWAWN